MPAVSWVTCHELPGLQEDIDVFPSVSSLSCIRHLYPGERPIAPQGQVSVEAKGSELVASEYAHAKPQLQFHERHLGARDVRDSETEKRRPTPSRRSRDGRGGAGCRHRGGDEGVARLRGPAGGGADGLATPLRARSHAGGTGREPKTLAVLQEASLRAVCVALHLLHRGVQQPQRHRCGLASIDVHDRMTTAVLACAWRNLLVGG
mmetsp:Transcript_117314/g.378611  ORF Transcript_117314/g.378611 Transcript_117314/m.378611 type:complete len:206 (-) Transcript_117314:728-1345(-)